MDEDGGQAIFLVEEMKPPRLLTIYSARTARLLSSSRTLTDGGKRGIPGICPDTRIWCQLRAHRMLLSISMVEHLRPAPCRPWRCIRICPIYRCTVIYIDSSRSTSDAFNTVIRIRTFCSNNGVLCIGVYIGHTSKHLAHLSVTRILQDAQAIDPQVFRAQNLAYIHSISNRVRKNELLRFVMQSPRSLELFKVGASKFRCLSLTPYIR